MVQCQANSDASHSIHSFNTSFKIHKQSLQMFRKTCHPTGVFKKITGKKIKNKNKQQNSTVFGTNTDRSSNDTDVSPTEEQRMHMRNAGTIPSSYQNVLS